MLPLQQDADSSHPRTAFAWAFVAMPIGSETAPLIVPVPSLEMMSEHFWKLGFRHHPELQQLKYSPPPANHNWIVGSAGHWVPMGEELPPEVTVPDISHLSTEEKSLLAEQLARDLAKGSDVNTAGVVE